MSGGFSLQKLHDLARRPLPLLNAPDERPANAPAVGTVYWVMLSNGQIVGDTWADDATDFARHALGNCFESEGKAQRELDRKRLEQRLRALGGSRTSLGEWVLYRHKGRWACYPEPAVVSSAGEWRFGAPIPHHEMAALRPFLDLLVDPEP